MKTIIIYSTLRIIFQIQFPKANITALFDKLKKIGYSAITNFTLNIASQTPVFFPNPAENVIIVPLYAKDETNHIQIINSVGQEMQNYTIKKQTSELRVDISAVSRGVYWIFINRQK